MERDGGFCKIKVPFRHLARVTVSLPLVAFLFVISWSILTDWERATNTHCEVFNALPSISAAMDGPRQQIVWKTFITIHALPRVLVIWMYYQYLQSIIDQQHLPPATIFGTCALNALENFGLLGITFISSKYHKDAHKHCFIMFLICSELYSIILTLLLEHKRSVPPTILESKSTRFKKKFIFLNLASLCCAMYAYARHNSLCEPGVYTIFAIFEYWVVLCNMAFHMTAYLDFYHAVLTIDPCKCQLSLSSLSPPVDNFDIPYEILLKL